MSRLKSILETLSAIPVDFDAFGRSGRVVAHADGAEFVGKVTACRRLLRSVGLRGSYVGGSQTRGAGMSGLGMSGAGMTGAGAGGRRVVGLLFRPEETIEFLVGAFAAIGEGFAVVPLYPNWSEASQTEYLKAYGIRSLLIGRSYRSRVGSWRGSVIDEAHAVALDTLETPRDLEPYPDLGPDQPCAYIFTSGTSGSIAKLTEISIGNLDAAIQNIEELEFLSAGMTLHSPLSTSHIFAFVVVLGILAIRPRRLIFSDIQYLARLPQSATGPVGGLILVPVVLNRIRAGFYEKLVTHWRRDEVPKEYRKLARIPLSVRRGLKRLLARAEDACIELETNGHIGARGGAAIQVVRRLLGKRIRERLGSPDFVVVGGAKPNLRAMAFLEVMGIRVLQGWGMTETTGPLAVCSLGDRYRGAFGTCGKLFDSTTATLEEGELIVGGPQVARGYVEAGGRFVSFDGTKRTGDYAEFDPTGRLKILGKASDRITTENGLNYNPVPIEERLLAADLESEHRFEEIVVVGDGQARLGLVIFLREGSLREGTEFGGSARAYVKSLLAVFNAQQPVDERLEIWTVAEESFKDSELLGPSGKLVRRRAEEKYAAMFPATVAP